MEKLLVTRAGFDTHVAEGEDVRTNFWLVFFERKHTDRNYIRMCNTFKNHNNLDVVAFGKMLSSLPTRRGYSLMKHLSYLLPPQL